MKPRHMLPHDALSPRDAGPAAASGASGEPRAPAPAPAPGRAPPSASGADVPSAAATSSGLTLGWPEQFLFDVDVKCESDDPGPVLPLLGVHGAGLGLQTSNSAAAPLPVLPATGPSDNLSFAEFFLKNGAWRPPAPCTYCQRQRLQCFMLQASDTNPSPVLSCSSCVALLRQCSLAAELPKREPSGFEPAAPAVGQPDGAIEEGQPAKRSKRSGPLSVRKTQVLRDWFTANMGHPYPTGQGKSALADKAGLSRTQVVNWFSNARRRHRPPPPPVDDGTTTPRRLWPLSAPGMTPFERWRHAQPDNGIVLDPAMQEAPDAGSSKTAGSLAAAVPLEPSTSSIATLLALPAHYFSLSSMHSHRALDGGAALSALSGRNINHYLSRGGLRGYPRSPRDENFFCRFCSRAFTRKYDWLRHERSIHIPGAVSWICAAPVAPGQPLVLWRHGQDQPECIFCGRPSPSKEHFLSHEFEACAARAIQDRSFVRKDHMWQHLYKFHGCRKWEGWKPDLSLLWSKP